MNYKLLSLFALSFLCLSFTSISNVKEIKNNNTDPKLLAANAKVAFEAKCKTFYSSIESNELSLPNYESFSKAFEGYDELKKQGVIEKDYLTIVDFSLSSNDERMWVINMDTKEVVFRSLVAHGKNSGELFANDFSNKSESYQSSLGFYTTGETYVGKHGLSLRLDGLEYGINDNARERAVVIHGADYVSEEFVKSNGRLGRSLGCPAVPNELSKELIELIKDKSCLFIYHPSRNYITKSKLVS
ncbi:murein L,D-transpeptidase catalytic domain family protein [Flavobacterium jejuense]|uniref:Murein L,D-transpeptidase catalytic domain family protein n=1 Tax=Flavobacterium jejuense TaxID=1544455 RepID=A0ABX0IWI3_9FLAO|nr:murein L,D-transpeptidase catalytic domain family protein [Flavobacterium jejuense]NHN26441.1 murein L,D-transpeptidase catalytic domain family protein [Flavobacterium jejuense]